MIRRFMMTSSNGIIFRIAGPLWGESTGHQLILLTKASDAELWCFLWSAPDQTIEQTTVTPVIWDANRTHYDVTVMLYFVYADELYWLGVMFHTQKQAINSMSTLTWYWLYASVPK